VSGVDVSRHNGAVSSSVVQRTVSKQPKECRARFRGAQLSRLMSHKSRVAERSPRWCDSLKEGLCVDPLMWILELTNECRSRLKHNYAERVGQTIVTYIAQSQRLKKVIPPRTRNPVRQASLFRKSCFIQSSDPCSSGSSGRAALNLIGLEADPPTFKPSTRAICEAPSNPGCAAAVDSSCQAVIPI
jgi:hypothetical protein